MTEIKRTIGELTSSLNKFLRALTSESNGVPPARAKRVVRRRRKVIAKKSGKKTPSQMRCRAEVDGKQCQKRSRGPRYHYLCADHAKKE